MDSDNDPRSIDWAPRKIEAIEGQLAELERRYENLVREVSHQGIAFNRQLAEIRDRHRELVKQGADEIEALTERLNELQNAIASKVRDELSAGFRDLEPEPEFSAPIGAVFGERRGDPADYLVKRNPTKHGGIFAVGNPKRGVVIDNFSQVQDRIMGASALRDEAFGRGYSMGVSAAIDEAEKRVITALDRAGIFSPTTRRRILDALRRTDRKLLGEKGPAQNSGS